MPNINKTNAQRLAESENGTYAQDVTIAFEGLDSCLGLAVKVSTEKILAVHVVMPCVAEGLNRYLELLQPLSDALDIVQENSSLVVGKDGCGCNFTVKDKISSLCDFKQHIGHFKNLLITPDSVQKDLNDESKTDALTKINKCIEILKKIGKKYNRNDWNHESVPQSGSSKRQDYICLKIRNTPCVIL